MTYFHAEDVTSYYYVPDVSCADLYSLFGNLTLDLNTHRVALPPSAYLKDFALDYYGETQPMCRILIQPSRRPSQAVLGVPFLQIYNLTYSPARSSFRFQGPYTDLPSTVQGFPGWAIALIVLGSIVLLGLAGFLLYRCTQKRRLQKLLIEKRQLVVGSRGLSVFGSNASTKHRINHNSDEFDSLIERNVQEKFKNLPE